MECKSLGSERVTADAPDRDRRHKDTHGEERQPDSRTGPARRAAGKRCRRVSKATCIATKAFSVRRSEQGSKASPTKLWSIGEMERSGGEPDVVGRDEETGEYLIFDCSPELVF